MSEESTTYSSIGFCCIVEPSSAVSWSNQYDLFRKIVSSRKFRSTFAAASLLHTGFEHRITFESVRYRTTFNPIPGMRYLGVAYPEDCFVRKAYSEMYARIFNIRSNSGKSVFALSKAREALESSGAPDDALLALDEAIRFNGEMMNDSSNILRLFDAEHICSYVDISESLDSTYKLVKKYNGILNRTILFDTEIECKVARVNYTILDSALLEIIRVMYRCMPDGSEASLKIRCSRSSEISLSTDIKVFDEFSVSSVDYELRDICCAFECLGGKAEAVLNGDRFVIRAGARIPLSNYICRVSPDGGIGEVRLRGYSRIMPKRTGYGTVTFRSPEVEYKVDFKALLADIMLGSLFEYSEA